MLSKQGAARELRPGNLLSGILLGHADSPFASDVSKPHLLVALQDLVVLLRAPSLEILLLDGAADIRERYGIAASRVALETTMAVLPQSSMTLSDYIVATWRAIACCVNTPDIDHAPRMVGRS